MRGKYAKINLKICINKKVKKRGGIFGDPVYSIYLNIVWEQTLMEIKFCVPIWVLTGCYNCYKFENKFSNKVCELAVRYKWVTVTGELRSKYDSWQAVSAVLSDRLAFSTVNVYPMFNCFPPRVFGECWLHVFRWASYRWN